MGVLGVNQIRQRVIASEDSRGCARANMGGPCERRNYAKFSPYCQS